MTKECIMIEERRLEIDEEIRNLIKEAIFLSKKENEEIYKFANRKLKLKNKDENKKDEIKFEKERRKEISVKIQEREEKNP